MVIYPIRVKRKQYRGMNPREQEKTRNYNELAKVLEGYINEKIKEDESEVQQYIYGNIASDLNLEIAEVREILFSVDCGHNGFTVKKVIPSN